MDLKKQQYRKPRPIEFVIDETGCHICTSHKPNAYGYPCIKINGKSLRIHRYLYQQCVGEIANGLVVRHTCDNRLCINIDHLKLGTQADNIYDRDSRGRMASQHGANNPRARITEEQAIEIISFTGKAKIIAEKFGISPRQVYTIRQRKSWTHLSV